MKKIKDQIIVEQERELHDNYEYLDEVRAAKKAGLVYGGINEDGEVEWVGTDAQHKLFRRYKDEFNNEELMPF